MDLPNFDWNRSTILGCLRSEFEKSQEVRDLVLELAEKHRQNAKSQERSQDKSEVIIKGFTEMIGMILNPVSVSSDNFENELLAKAQKFCENIVPEEQKNFIPVVFNALGEMIHPDENRIEQQNYSDSEESEDVSENANNGEDVCISIDENTVLIRSVAFSKTVQFEFPEHNMRVGDKIKWSKGIHKVLEVFPSAFIVEVEKPFESNLFLEVPAESIEKWYPETLLEFYERNFLDSLEFHWEHYIDKFLNDAAESNNENLCVWLLKRDEQYNADWTNGNPEMKSAFDYMLFFRMKSALEWYLFECPVNDFSVHQALINVENGEGDFEKEVSYLILKWAIGKELYIDWTDEQAKKYLTDAFYWDLFTPEFLIKLSTSQQQIAFEFLRQRKFH